MDGRRSGIPHCVDLNHGRWNWRGRLVACVYDGRFWRCAVNTASEKFPDQYLHVEECRSGETWIMPLRSNTKLNLKRLIKRWVKREYGGELQLDGEPMPRLSGDYYAKIITDGRPPDSVVVWTSGEFYLKATY
jgi:hypothetical protein